MYDPYKSTWLNPSIEYLFDEEIIEYDIGDAGFSLIKSFKLLPPNEISRLEALGKGFNRHKEIGILQRNDKIFTTKLLEKFALVREMFINFNNLNDNNIISVKKDAIFTIGKCDKLKFGNHIEFHPKNVYTSYIRFTAANNIEIYYSIDAMDVKGIGESGVNRHRLYMMEFLRKMIAMIESKDPKAKRFIMNFIDGYKHNEIDEAFYLEFNNMSTELNPIFNYQKILIPIVQILLREMG